MADLKSLTHREREVLMQLAQGQQNKEIALTLGIAEHTVENHLKRIYHKLGVRNRAEAGMHYWQNKKNDGNPPYTLH